MIFRKRQAACVICLQIDDVRPPLGRFWAVPELTRSTGIKLNAGV
jgi:hypothetical protein